MSFSRPNPATERAARTYAALTRLAERHADTVELRVRSAHPSMPAPHEMVRLTTLLAGGSVPVEQGEPAVDTDDLLAALTLVPTARDDFDLVELALLQAARARGLTWQDIAHGLGLGTPQAARQRYERLAGRAEPTS